MRAAGHEGAGPDDEYRTPNRQVDRSSTVSGLVPVASGCLGPYVPGPGSLRDRPRCGREVPCGVISGVTDEVLLPSEQLMARAATAATVVDLRNPAPLAARLAIRVLGECRNIGDSVLRELVEILKNQRRGDSAEAAATCIGDPPPAEDDPVRLGIWILLALTADLLGQERFREAEPLVLAAAALAESALGESSHEVALSLRSLGDVQQGLGCLQAAGLSYRRALGILDGGGGDHSDTVILLSRLGEIEHILGRHAESERYRRRALDIRLRVLSSEDPELASCCVALASALVAQAKYEEAEPLLRRALRIARAGYGHDSAVVAVTSCELAALLRSRGSIDEAIHLLKNALTIQRGLFGPSHPEVVKTLHNLALLHESAGRLDVANSLWAEARVAVEPCHAASRHSTGTFREAPTTTRKV